MDISSPQYRPSSRDVPHVLDPTFDNIADAEARYASEVARTGGIAFDIGFDAVPWAGGGALEVGALRPPTRVYKQRKFHRPNYVRPSPTKEGPLSAERAEWRRITMENVEIDRAKRAGWRAINRRTTKQIQLVADAYAALRRFHRGCQ